MIKEIKTLYKALLSRTSEVTGLLPYEILHSRETDAVDARNIIVYLLHKRGVYNKHISRLTGITTAGISYILSNFENRKVTNKYLSSILQAIEKENI